VKEEIAKSYREGEKAMMVHEGGNKAGRYLEVSILAEGGRKGVIWLPEDRFGRGWRQFAGELRLLVEAQVKSSGSEKFGDPMAKVLKDALIPGVKSGRSFVQVLHSNSVGEERVVCSLRSLDLFPMLFCFESRFDSEGLRSAVDCSALDEPVPGPLEAAAGSARASTSFVDEAGLMTLLGLVNLKLDRVIARLIPKPTRRSNKVRILGPANFTLG
jgi:hypothetical protein